MEFFVGIIAAFTAVLVWIVVDSARNNRRLRTAHVLSLGRLQDAVRLNLPTTAAELISAAIDEEIEGA